MSNNFNWQTDEEAWPETEAPSAPLPKKPLHRQPHLWFLLVIAIISLGLTISYLLLQRRAFAATSSLRADITSSFEFVEGATTIGDMELLNAYLSPDEAWQTTQISLAEAGYSHSLTPFRFDRTTDTTTINAISLDPTQKEATITYQHHYVGDTEAETIDTFYLERTAVYHLQNGRWLWHPLPEELWGEEETRSDRHLDLTCPQRDLDTCDRLVTDIDAYIARACRDIPDLAPLCNQQSARLALKFSTDPLSLAAFHNPNHIWGSQNTFTLPTPTLVGQPTDEIAYQALMRGYARLIVARFITEQLNWTCCQHVLAYQALLTHQLHTLELEPPPLTNDDYITLYNDNNTLFAAFDGWRTTDLDTLPADAPQQLAMHAVVDYLLTTSNNSAITLQRALQRQNNYWLWLQTSNINNVANERLLYIKLRQFLASQHPPTNLTLATPPTPFPDQQIQLLCDTDDNRLELTHFDPTLAQWGTSYSIPNDYAFIAPTSQDNGFILQERALNWESPTLLWRWDQPQPRLLHIETNVNGSQDIVGFGRSMSPDERYMTMYVSDGRSSTYSFRLLDSTSCTDHGCHTYDIAGAPLWSPDNRWLLLRRPHQQEELSTLYIANNAGDNAISFGNGYAPFWLDNDHFGWVTNDDKIMMSSIADLDEPAIIFSLDDTRHRLPRTLLGDNAQIEAIIAPDMGNLFITVRDIHDQQYLLWYNRLTGEIKQLLVASIFHEQPQLSATGRYLTLVATSISRSENPILFIYDRQTESLQERPFTSDNQNAAYDWAQNDDWLFHLKGDSLTLLTSDLAYETNIPHPYPSCRDALWSNPLPSS